MDELSGSMRHFRHIFLRFYTYYNATGLYIYLTLKSKMIHMLFRHL